MTNVGSSLRDVLWRFKQNRKAQVIVAVICVAVIGASIGVILALRFQHTPISNQNQQIGLNNLGTAETGQQRRMMDGVLVSSLADAQVVPVAVMIENLSTIRPQKGLGAASVVYEALAEGGITRCMAVFAGPGQLASIGPVRSAREYFVHWADEYRGMYAHAGGSPQALAALADDQSIVDLNQIGGDQIYFWRDLATSAPHNLFTSSEKLAFALRDFLGNTPVASFESWKFKDDVVKESRPTGDHHVLIDFSSDSYQVEWKYVRKTNTYERWNGGEQQVDGLTNTPLTAHTVVVQFVNTQLIDESTGRLGMSTEGSGKALVFEDGVRQDGTWKKNDQSSRTRFYNASGEEIAFNAGTIWLEILPDDREITSN